MRSKPSIVYTVTVNVDEGILQLEGFVATGFLSGGGRISYSEHAR